jgi:hypothetical protein
MSDATASGTVDSYRGGCLCGAVRYEARGPARNPNICHCESCRKSAGSAGVAWATYVYADLRYIRGKPTEFASSARVLRGFCDHCGTTLTYWHDSRPDDVDVTIASLDDPAALPPAMHIWMVDALSWEQPGDSLPRYHEWRTEKNK